MKISGKLEGTDYLESQHLHLRPSRWVQITRTIFLAVVALILAAWLLVIVLRGGFISAALYALPLVVVIGMLGFNFYVALPRKVRQLYEQNKEMSAPFEQEVTDSSFISSNQYGRVERPWGHFRKWKENTNLFMLYTTDRQYLLVPKRFCSAQDIEEFRTQLRKNNIPEARTSLSGAASEAALYIVLLVAIGALIDQWYGWSIR